MGTSCEFDENPSTITYYHAHAYYDAERLEEATQLVSHVKQRFHVDIGRVHEKPVGPHPVWSCQITVPRSRFAEIIPWLALNRGRVDFFIHPVTGNDLEDHTSYVMWLGKSYGLKTAMFKD